jgi:hypothetical protein
MVDICKNFLELVISWRRKIDLERVVFVSIVSPARPYKVSEIMHHQFSKTNCMVAQ